MKRLPLFILLSAIACPGPAGTSGDGGPGVGSDGGTSQASCSITVFGGPTGTYDCLPVTIAWSSSNNQGAIGFMVISPSLDVAIGFTGEPQVGTHTQNDAGATGGITLQTGSGAATQVWSATAPHNGQPAQGSYTLTFTSIDTMFATTDGKVYGGHGSVNATLIPLTGQSGNVTVSATF